MPIIGRDVREAAARLRGGGVVAFATETVYGLGCNAENQQAIARLYALKNRPRAHPLILHLPSLLKTEEWTQPPSAATLTLAKKFTPGPLTLIFRRGARAPAAITGGQQSIAVRAPAHKTAQALLRAFGGGIAAPSANKFGHLSATSAAAVAEEFKDEDDLYILDGGMCRAGLESAIVDARAKTPVLLRPGTITAAQINAALGKTTTLSLNAAAAKVRAPGTLPRHYAPRTPLKIMDAKQLSAAIKKHGANIAAFTPRRPLGVAAKNWRQMPATAVACARVLYRRLRELDHIGAKLIIAAAPPQNESWRAINDRLNRAAFGGFTKTKIKPRAKRG